MRPTLEMRLALALGGVCCCLPPGAWLLGQAGSAGIRWGLFLLGTGLVCAAALAWLIFARLLAPIRHLAREVGGRNGEDAAPLPADTDSIDILTRRVRRLREKVQLARAELEESHENLRQTEKLALVGKLAAGVAHSFRNPLTGLKLRMFSLTKGMDLTPRQQEDLAAVNDAVRHMETIATNFLEFSRRPRLSMADVNISDVVDGTLSLLKPRLESFQVRVELHRPDRMPLVDADAEQLREALANIIVNACEAMGVGGTLTITEETGRLEPLGHVVVLRISDTGPGISPDMEDVVFQPFISTKAEGTGLGLPISKRIFEEHGGWLHLHSAPGRGATFAAVLPARKDDDLWIRS